MYAVPACKIVCFSMTVVVTRSSVFDFPLCIHNLYTCKGCSFELHEGFAQYAFPHCMSVLLFVCDGSVKAPCFYKVQHYHYCSCWSISANRVQ